MIVTYSYLELKLYKLRLDLLYERKLNTPTILNYFMLSGRISRNIGENIFRSYTGTSENTDFHVLVA